jgi:sulfite reductase beta subunit-like hemoprotein
VNNAEQTLLYNVLDALPELSRFAGAESPLISADDEARLRNHGIYTQRPVEQGFFMVRIRIPGGALSPVQLETIADLAGEYGRDLVDITVRQNMQLHWVRPQSLRPILDRLHSVGLSTSEACGTSARNIVNCPVAGADRDELFDTSGMVGDVSGFLSNNQDFSQLPRKLKITITGCALLCVYPEISDIGIFAVHDPHNGRPVFRARIGGGLSGSPRFARDLGVVIDPEDVVAVCNAIASEFRDRVVSRGNSAGPHFTVAESEVDAFRRQVEARLGRTLGCSDYLPPPPAHKDRSHLGIHRQQKAGVYYVGLSILGGRTSGAEMRRLAGLAVEYGGGRIRTTNSQNIVLLDIPERNITVLTDDLKSSDFHYEASWARKGMLACTGIQFCKLALTETKNRVAELGTQLEKQLDLDEPIRISVTGCPNSCGQHHICDVGLEGSLTTVDGVKQEAFQVFLGGGVGNTDSFGRRIGSRIPAERLGQSLAALFRRYQALRSQGESFQDFCLRHSDDALSAFLRPADLAPDQPVAAAVTTRQANGDSNRLGAVE